MPWLYSRRVAHGTARPRRATRRAGGRGRAGAWLGLGVLVMVGLAVLAARTVALPRSGGQGVAEPTSAATVRGPQTPRPVAVPGAQSAGRDRSAAGQATAQTPMTLGAQALAAT